MDYRKSNAPTNTVTRDMMKLSEETGNVYETVAIISKRANQISVEMKQDLEKKLQEFASYNDNLEEVFENREQIEISRYYESRPFHLKRTNYHVTKNTNCLPANYRGAYGRYLILAVGRVATRRRPLLVRC